MPGAVSGSLVWNVALRIHKEPVLEMLLFNLSMKNNSVEGKKEKGPT